VGVTKGANSFQALSDAIEAGGVNGGASDHGGILSPSSRLPTEGGRDIKEMNAPRAPGSGDTRDYTILIVDNDATCVRLLRAVLENSGYSTDTANSGEGALGKVKINRYDCIISDFALEGLRGDELARRVKSMRPIPLILLTGFRPAIKPSELMDFDYVFQKPVNPTELLDVLRSIERAR
jgi:CheY-like chemotaxis protein